MLSLQFRVSRAQPLQLLIFSLQCIYTLVCYMAESCYKVDLGDNIYVLVSAFKNYPSIGIRKCVINKDKKVLPTKEGINFILPQFKSMQEESVKVSESLNEKRPYRASLGYGMVVQIERKKKAASPEVVFSKEKSSVGEGRENQQQQLKPQQIRLNTNQFIMLMAMLSEIENAVEDQWRKINPMDGLYFLCAVGVAQKLANDVYPFGCTHHDPYANSQCLCDVWMNPTGKVTEYMFNTIKDTYSNSSKMVEEVFSKYLKNHSTQLGDGEIGAMASRFAQKYLVSEKGIAAVCRKVCEPLLSIDEEETKVEEEIYSICNKVVKI